MLKVFRTPLLANLALALCLAGGGATLFTRPAAGNMSVGVTPSVVQLSMNEGGTRRRELTVSNEGDESFSVVAEASSLTGASESSSAVSWITIEPLRFELAPGETRPVRVVVNAPPDVVSGGYYAVATLTTEARAVDGTGAAVAGKLGVPLLITVDGSGEPVVSAEVERFAAVLEADGRVGFRAEVHNTGNTHVVLRGSTEVMTAHGTPVDRRELGVSTVILPGDRAVVEGPPGRLLESGRHYRATTELDYGGSKPLLGETEFEVTAPRVKLRDLRLCERRDGGVELRFRLDNSGMLGVVPTVTLAARSLDDPIGDAPMTLDLAVAWPGANSSYALEIPPQLNDGNDWLGVTVESGATARFNQLLSFHTGGEDEDALVRCDG